MTPPTPATPSVAPRFVVVRPPIAADLREALLSCWVEVTNAGGAVGFVAPVTADDVAKTLDDALARVGNGRVHLGVLRPDVGSPVPDGLLGFGFLEVSASSLRQHWATIRRLQVHPAAQGRGYGGALLGGLHGLARELGLEFVTLQVRGGTGTEGFYARQGYAEVGRIPGAIRLGPGDDRDEIHMVRRFAPKCGVGSAVTSAKG